MTTLSRVDELALTVTGQCIAPERTALECRVTDPNPWCRRCGAEGVVCDSVSWVLAHEPFGHRPTTLIVGVWRYRCDWCQKVWREDTSRAAGTRAKISHSGARRTLEAVVLDHLTVSRAAARHGGSWHTANTAILTEGTRQLINDPHRFDGVTTIGVDEHVWRHTLRGDKYVTSIIELTPAREKRGPARLLDMVEGRSKAVFSAWLATWTPACRSRIETVAMEGFTGFKTASKQHLPAAGEGIAQFHVVQLAGDMLDRVRQRVQQETLGHRGRTGAPLYATRRVLCTGEAFLTGKQQARLDVVFQDPAHADVWRAWREYQQVVAAYREKYSGLGRKRLRELIDTLKSTTPAWFVELRKLAYTLDRRRSDILAYFDLPRISNGPTEAVNGRLEDLRGSALGVRNLTNYIARALLETGGFRPLLHPQMR